MEHSFNVWVAKRYGVNSAILLNNLNFWIAKNRANGVNFNDGHFWTYNSKKAFAELFPYMNERQIDYALKKLIDDGIIITGNYNKMAYDRTLWYAITKKGYSILQNCEMEDAKLQNGNVEIVEPIPDVISFNKPEEKPVDKGGKKTTRFQKPSIEEIKAYCKERNNGIDAERFFDYYEAIGWKVGKNTMKDWKACVRTWERNQRQDEKPKEAPAEKPFKIGGVINIV